MFKKFFFVLIILFFSPVMFCHAQETDWMIDNYWVNIQIMENSDLEITEKLEVNFESQKHGIFRYIPLHYKDDLGLNYNLRIENMEVLNELNQNIKYTTNKKDGKLYVKIGDPEKTISGMHTYLIKYKVMRAMRFFDDYDELYWTAIGNFPVVINQALVQVEYPSIIKHFKVNAQCFTGEYGSIQQNCSFTFENPNKVLFTANDFSANQNFTVDLSFPKGFIEKPDIVAIIFYYVKDNIFLILPIFGLLVLLYFWYKYGRDPANNKTIVAQYEPFDNLTPAEMGSIIDETVHLSDISADIINLAVKGYLKIKETEKGVLKNKKYELINLKKDINDLKEHEKLLLKSLFDHKESVNLDDLKNKFYTNIPILQKQIYDQLMEYKFFVKNPRTVRGIYYAVGGILLVCSLIAFFSINRMDAGFGLIILAFFAFIFANFMPQKTTRGSHALWHTMGLKEYINVAEKYRIQFQEKENIFEILLPYAMIFGLSKKWAKNFENIYQNQNPNWFESTHVFNSISLVNSLNNFQQTSNANLKSAPSNSSSGSGFSSGGGFSGGGFGGGGGGSW